jgi:precorrin-2 methylase
VKKTTFDRIWDQVRQRYGVYLRLIETLPEAQLQTNPIPGMRSPAELVAHLSSGVVRGIMQGIAVGTVRPEDESAIALGFEDKKDVIRLARECWK